MTIKASAPAHKIADTDEPTARAYKAWKHGKVERGLEQTKDRAEMIPADKVWRDLGLED